MVKVVKPSAKGVVRKRPAAAVSFQQTAKIAQKREEALKRKQEKQHQKRVVLPRMLSGDDDEDPFGHGTSFGN